MLEKKKEQEKEIFQLTIERNEMKSVADKLRKQFDEETRSQDSKTKDADSAPEDRKQTANLQASQSSSLAVITLS